MYDLREIFFRLIIADADGTEKNLQHNNPATVHPDGEASKAEPAKADEEGGDDDEEEPINMEFPTESILKGLIYIVTFPLMGPLYITLPDTKNREFTMFPSFSVPGNLIHSNHLFSTII